MQLLDFIGLIAQAQQPDSASIITRLHIAPDDAEYQDVYMADTLDLGSELVLLDQNETDDLLEYYRQGRRYVWLSGLEELIEMVESLLEDGQHSHQAVAERLMHYRLHDA